MTEARVPVTVEDREAGQRLLDRLHAMLRRQGAEVDDKKVDDDGEIVQALAAHRLAGVAAGREEAQAEIAMLRGHLTTIIDRMGKGDRDAPGHSHDKPGIWDADNKPGVAGTKCQWCAEWGAARAAIRQMGGE